MRTLKELKQVDGRITKSDNQSVEDVSFQPTTLEQLIGNSALSSGKYDTEDREEYLNELSGMTINDLRSHAVSKGIVPRDVSKERLTKQLLAKFIEYNARYKKPILKSSQISNKSKAEITSILSSSR